MRFSSIVQLSCFGFLADLPRAKSSHRAPEFQLLGDFGGLGPVRSRKKKNNGKLYFDTESLDERLLRESRNSNYDSESDRYKTTDLTKDIKEFKNKYELKIPNFMDPKFDNKKPLKMYVTSHFFGTYITEILRKYNSSDHSSDESKSVVCFLPAPERESDLMEKLASSYNMGILEKAEIHNWSATDKFHLDSESESDDNSKEARRTQRELNEDGTQYVKMSLSYYRAIRLGMNRETKVHFVFAKFEYNDNDIPDSDSESIDFYRVAAVDWLRYHPDNHNVIRRAVYRVLKQEQVTQYDIKIINNLKTKLDIQRAIEGNIEKHQMNLLKESKTTSTDIKFPLVLKTVLILPIPHTVDPVVEFNPNSKVQREIDDMVFVEYMGKKYKLTSSSDPSSSWIKMLKVEKVTLLPPNNNTMDLKMLLKVFKLSESGESQSVTDSTLTSANYESIKNFEVLFIKFKDPETSSIYNLNQIAFYHQETRKNIINALLSLDSDSQNVNVLIQDFEKPTNFSINTDTNTKFNTHKSIAQSTGKLMAEIYNINYWTNNKLIRRYSIEGSDSESKFEVIEIPGSDDIIKSYKASSKSQTTAKSTIDEIRKLVKSQQLVNINDDQNKSLLYDCDDWCKNNEWVSYEFEMQNEDNSSSDRTTSAAKSHRKSEKTSFCLKHKSNNIEQWTLWKFKLKHVACYKSLFEIRDTGKLIQPPNRKANNSDSYYTYFMEKNYIDIPRIDTISHVLVPQSQIVNQSQGPGSILSKNYTRSPNLSDQIIISSNCTRKDSKVDENDITEVDSKCDHNEPYYGISNSLKLMRSNESTIATSVTKKIKYDTWLTRQTTYNVTEKGYSVEADYDTYFSEFRTLISGIKISESNSGESDHNNLIVDVVLFFGVADGKSGQNFATSFSNFIRALIVGHQSFPYDIRNLRKTFVDNTKSQKSKSNSSRRDILSYSDLINLHEGIHGTDLRFVDGTFTKYGALSSRYSGLKTLFEKLEHDISDQLRLKSDNLSLQDHDNQKIQPTLRLQFLGHSAGSLGVVQFMKILDPFSTPDNELYDILELALIGPSSTSTDSDGNGKYKQIFGDNEIVDSHFLKVFGLLSERNSDSESAASANNRKLYIKDILEKSGISQFRKFLQEKFTPNQGLKESEDERYDNTTTPTGLRLFTHNSKDEFQPESSDPNKYNIEVIGLATGSLANIWIVGNEGDALTKTATDSTYWMKFIINEHLKKKLSFLISRDSNFLGLGESVADCYAGRNTSKTLAIAPRDDKRLIGSLPTETYNIDSKQIELEDSKSDQNLNLSLTKREDKYLFFTNMCVGVLHNGSYSKDSVVRIEDGDFVLSDVHARAQKDVIQDKVKYKDFLDSISGDDDSIAYWHQFDFYRDLFRKLPTLNHANV